MIRTALRSALAALFSGLLCAASAGAAEPLAADTFDILEYTVEGNTRLPQIDIERAVYPFLGEGKTIKDAEAAREALEKAYRDRGYLTVLVDIPPQAVNQGAVVLKVTEATVEKLRITGSRYYSLGAIREGVPSLAEGEVPNFNDVQRELSQLNRSPGRNVAPVMRPAQTPGQVEVELQVKDEFPLHATLEANNHYSMNTSHTRIAGQLRYDNLWQLQHSISLQFQEAPERPSDSQVASVSYVMPGGGDRSYVFYAVRSNSNVASLGSLNVIGNGEIYGLRLVQTLPPAEGLTHTLSLGVDYKHFKENVVQQSGAVQTPITYLPFSIQYSAVLPQLSGSSTAFDTGVGFIVRGLMADLDEFANKRALADTAYAVLRAGVQRTQMLPAGWQLFGRFDTQLASGALVNSEQLAAGGASTVRGYLESEAMGDDGVRGGLELRTPRLLPATLGSVKTFYLLAFTDGARLRVRDALPGQQRHFNLSSAGFGLRLEARGFGLELDAAHAFKDGGSATTNTHAGENRVSFRGSYEF